jgi:CHRD domain
MLTYRRLLIAIVLGALLGAAGAAGASSSRTFKLTLRGSASIPRGDRNDSAKAILIFDASKRRVCWTFSSYRGIGNPSRAKIGKAPKGKNGSIVVTLSKPFLPKGCSTVTAQTLTAILKRPAAYYIIITNALHPNGSARAQL